MRHPTLLSLSFMLASCSAEAPSGAETPDTTMDAATGDAAPDTLPDTETSDALPDSEAPDTAADTAPEDTAPSDADSVDTTPDTVVDTTTDDTLVEDGGTEPAAWVTTTGSVSPDATCAADATCAPGVVQAGRETRCGTIASGTDTFALPAPLTPGPVAAALYDTCTGTGENTAVDSSLETVVVNAGGEVVTASLFADNYFELFVNGVMVGRDGLGFTPFNAAAVRFQASYPMTVVVSLVDWEGYLGVGLEDRTGALHIGDGGFIASFSNGLQTGADWKCEAFYAAPLDNDGCLRLTSGGGLDSSACPQIDATVGCVTAGNADGCQAAHLRLPAGWSEPGFDDSTWSAAHLFAADLVTRDPAYATFAATRFASASFIWSGNLNLDNHVVCRVTLDAPP